VQHTLSISLRQVMKTLWTPVDDTFVSPIEAALHGDIMHLRAHRVRHKKTTPKKN